MNRWLLGCCVVIILAIASVYFLIPTKLVVSKIVLLKCNANSADRVLGDTGTWIRWWPAGQPNDVTYRRSQRLLRSEVIEIAYKDVVTSSVLSISPFVNSDSCALVWQFTIDASYDPLKRIGQYEEAKHVKGQMGDVLNGFKEFLEKEQNVYGITIREAMVKGSIVEETSATAGTYPNTGMIYGLVEKLERCISRGGRLKTGPPMVNITPAGRGGYQLRVALPADSAVPDAGDIRSRNVPTDKFLETYVHGGEGTVSAAFEKMDTYIRENHRTVMALPFASLITDRRKEADTTKWVTRILYPILPR